MENNDLSIVEKRLVARFLDMFIKFGLILALGSFCFTVFSPFMNMMLWALILAVTLYPLHQRFAARLGGKQGKASTLLVLLGVLLIVAPTVVMVSSLGDSVSALVDKVNNNTLVIPAPSADIADIPLVGAKLHAVWLKASVDLPSLIISYQPQLGDLAKKVVGILAFIQALLAGIVMMLAGIPAVGIFFVLALILGIAQVPVILVTAPAIAYMWSTGDHGTAVNIIYSVLLIVAGMADNVLKPLLLGRGVDAPMPVVLLGALGGMATSGILGMFIGATLLSIGYRIFMAWVNEGLASADK